MSNKTNINKGSIYNTEIFILYMHSKSHRELNIVDVSFFYHSVIKNIQFTFVCLYIVIIYRATNLVFIVTNGTYQETIFK